MQKRFWDTRKITAYSISETESRHIIEIEYTEPFRDGLAVHRMIVYLPR